MVFELVSIVFTVVGRAALYAVDLLGVPEKWTYSSLADMQACEKKRTWLL